MFDRCTVSSLMMATIREPEIFVTSGQKLITFCLKISDKTREIVADRNSTLAEAIEQFLSQEEFPIYNYILLAQLEGRDEAAVSPVLMCKWLKENGIVRTIKKENSNPFRSMPDAGPREQSIYFLKTTERRGRERMTDTRYTLYEGKDLCVTAFNQETLNESLQKDLRLVNVDRFHLCRESSSLAPSVSLDVVEARHYNGDIFKVNMETCTRKRKSSVSSSETISVGPPIKKAVTGTENPEEDDVIVVYASFSATLKDPFTSEIGENMIKQVQEDARSTLLSPRQRQTDRGRAGLYNLVTKFAKKIPTARPARILELLGRYTKSVGYLWCGNVKGTCFLVAQNMVMTSHHIINMINEARGNVTDQVNYDAHAKICIYFDYLYVGQLFSLSPVYVDETNGIGNSHLDYAILRLEENEILKNRVPLGPEVRNNVPNSGIVTIIGHPGGGEMLEDACSIIPMHESNITEAVDARFKKEEQNCQKNPESCSVRNIFANCVHMHRGRVKDHSNQLAYDTTLFHGSSGSPVFNADGHIVAMHTQGYPVVDSKGKNTSVVEFGVTFAAIISDIKNSNEIAIAELFPKYYC